MDVWRKFKAKPGVNDRDPVAGRQAGRGLQSGEIGADNNDFGPAPAAGRASGYGINDIHAF